MKIEANNNQGITWSVEATGEIEVIVCPNCGDPAFIASIAPELQKITIVMNGREEAINPTGDWDICQILSDAAIEGLHCSSCGFPVSLPDDEE